SPSPARHSLAHVRRRSCRHNLTAAAEDLLKQRRIDQANLAIDEQETPSWFRKSFGARGYPKGLLRRISSFILRRSGSLRKIALRFNDLEDRLVELWGPFSYIFRQNSRCAPSHLIDLFFSNLVALACRRSRTSGHQARGDRNGNFDGSDAHLAVG